MTDPQKKVLSLLLTVLVVVGTVPAMSVGPVAASSGNTAGNTAGNSTTFHVEQGEQCYEVTALGDGTQSVEDFYDYRNPETHPEQPGDWTYSSFGTTDLQENQGSKLFVYNGSEGYSLVILHDKFARDGGDGSYGSTVTFTMSGMGNVSWAVQDDTYDDGNQDDNWDTAGNNHQIDWMWAENRTDGGAVRNVEGETITIDPAFNESASAWGSWNYSGDANNRTESWHLIYGDKSEESLNMSQSLTVSTGSCSGSGESNSGNSDDGESDSPPTAKLSAPDTGALSKVFSLDASASTDDGSIERYKYDIDGDGTFEWFGGEMTGVEAWKYYEEPGTYTATVRVWDDEGQTDTDSVTFTIEKRDHTKPEAAIDVSDTVEVGQTVTIEATDFTEGPKTLEHIGWELNGEGTVDGQTWTTSFDETGEKQITLVLKDRAGNLNEITKTITVVSGDGTDGSNDGETNPGEGGVSDGDDTDSRTGGLPGANPGQNDENDGQNDGSTSAPLTDDDVSEVVVESMDAKSAPGLEVTDTAPESVESPTPDDGFEALSYLNVADANQATFTVSKAQLNQAGTTADAVTLFRYENGSWTAVETAQVDATDDAYEFSANVSDGTYAVGIDRPATDVTSVALGSQRVEPGDSVTVFVTVENDGRAEGTRTVNLTVGGEVVATQSVSVGAGEKQLVSFARTFDDSGVYEVSAGDEATEVVVEGIETSTQTTTTTTTTDEATGEVETSTTTTTNDSPGVPGFGVSASLIALVAAALLALRRR